jgi:hypothetical protein
MNASGQWMGVPMADMATSHIVNSVALLWRVTALRSRGLPIGDPTMPTRDGLVPERFVPLKMFSSMTDAECNKKVKEFLAELKIRDAGRNIHV